MHIHIYVFAHTYRYIDIALNHLSTSESYLQRYESVNVIYVYI